MENDYKNYIKFKDWKSENFGKYTVSEKIYYDKEFDFIPDIRKLSILEIGYGNGALMSYFRDKGADIFGIEVNKDLVSLAQKNNYIVCAADDLSTYLTRKFDLIVAIDVLEHIDKENLSDVVKFYFDRLDSGGIFFARFPNGDSPFGLRNQNGDITHRVQIGSEMIRQIFSSLNANDIVIRGEVISAGIGFLPYVRSIARKIFLEFVNVTVRVLFSSSGYYDFVSPNLVVIVKK